VFVWRDINGIGDLKSALGTLPHEFVDEQVLMMLDERVSGAVKGLLIEHNYVDKDYRSVFYKFYAKRGDEYGRNCVRIHFFSSGVSYDQPTMSLRLSQGENADAEAIDSELSASYLGYITLRPTGKDNIGRSVINPKLLSDASGEIITANHKVHVLGHRLKAIGFPWMMQHVDISVCAHVACWSIMRHYSERYSKYAELLLHDITKLAQPFDPGGLIPSGGLVVENAERIFYVANTFPLVVDREADPASFERQMLAYLESGFPIFATLPDFYHAVAIVGVRWRKGKAPVLDRSELDQPRSRVEALIASDDNHMPYVPVAFDTAMDPLDYRVDDIHSFIVPLPDKIFCPASYVDKLAEIGPDVLFELEFPANGDCVRRYYITTTAALRRDLMNRGQSFDPRLASALMTAPMSQFIWIVEYATVSQWLDDQVAVRLILDATASEADNDPFWIGFDSKTALVWGQKRGADAEPEVIDLKPAPQPYRRIRSNLKNFGDTGSFRD